MAIHRMKFLPADGISPMPGVIWSFILNREIIFSTTIQILEWSAEKRVDKGSVPCDADLMKAFEKAAGESGVSAVVMPSGAGHDANAIGHRIPVGMIFVPSRDGVSHCKEEWTDEADLEHGVEVLYRTVLDLDGKIN